MAKTLNKFKQGDVVQLKSGGPTMTITHIRYSYPHDNRDILVQMDSPQKSDPIGVHGYTCTWFNGKKVESAEFPEDTLRIPEEDKKERT